MLVIHQELPNLNVRRNLKLGVHLSSMNGSERHRGSEVDVTGTHDPPASLSLLVLGAAHPRLSGHSCSAEREAADGDQCGSPLVVYGPILQRYVWQNGV